MHANEKQTGKRQATARNQDQCQEPPAHSRRRRGWRSCVAAEWEKRRITREEQGMKGEREREVHRLSPCSHERREGEREQSLLPTNWQTAACLVGVGRRKEGGDEREKEIE